MFWGRWLEKGLIFFLNVQPLPKEPLLWDKSISLSPFSEFHEPRQVAVPLSDLCRPSPPLWDEDSAAKPSACPEPMVVLLDYDLNARDSRFPCPGGPGSPLGSVGCLLRVILLSKGDICHMSKNKPERLRNIWNGCRGRAWRVSVTILEVTAAVAISLTFWKLWTSFWLLWVCVAALGRSSAAVIVRSSLVAGRWLLTVAASPASDHRVWGTRASVVGGTRV